MEILRAASITAEDIQPINAIGKRDTYPMVYGLKWCHSGVGPTQSHITAIEECNCALSPTSIYLVIQLPLLHRQNAKEDMST